MLYYLFDWLENTYNTPGASLFGFITFRAALAIITSLILSIVFGGRVIEFLRSAQIGETVRELGLKGQQQKAGTPTMGGVIIIMSIMIPCLLFAKLDNIYIILLLISTTWMAIIGFTDDYIKVFKKNKEGLAGKFKVLGQVGLGIIIGATMLYSQEIVISMEAEEAEAGGYEVVTNNIDMVRSFSGMTDTFEAAHIKTTMTNLPILKDNELDYADLLFWMDAETADRWVWIIFIPIVIFIVTAVSNAANLTDGIDGLAAGVSAIIVATLGVLAYVSGNTLIADYLNILYLPDSGEIVVFSACFLGACIGFMWYNAFPAKVFMGDTGSLTIGGIIAALAILIRKELLIPILCGIFVVENLSVILQVLWFKYTKRKYGEGRRIFLMSPLHHHYQKMGMHESKIVTRFLIVGIMLAVLTVVTLKIR